MSLILFLLTLVISVLLVGGTVFLGKGRSGSQVKNQLSVATDEVKQLNSKVEALSEKGAKLASRSQLDGVVGELTEVNAAIESQRVLLKDIEQKLDRVQKDVETKEAEQQEVKSAKEDDEQRLQDLLATYQDVSTESVTLEQELAQSLKNLDLIMAEATLGDDQREMLRELSETLTAAGARLRDLITDYKAVNDRLEGLKAQHADLEDEYTKLVEQQLGA